MASTPQDFNLACVWLEDGAAPPAQPPAYSQAPPAGMSYPPGTFQPPPYSGGPGYAQQYPGAPPPSYPGAPPPQQYGVGAPNPPF